MRNHEPSSIASSAGKVSLGTALSRILGLIREQVVAYFFGAGMATDCFVVAFRVPNLLRDLFAEGALSSAFIPVFKEKIVRKGPSDAFRLANLTISSLILIVGCTVALGIIFAPQIIYITANGFTADPEKFTLTVTLTRIMFVYLLLVSISAVMMGILNSSGKFGIPAMSPALFNVGMILSPILLYQYFDVPVYTLAIGVIVGGIGQLVFQVPSLISIGYRFRFVINFTDEGLHRIKKLITPMILGLSASRINILINTLLASLLVEGAMSYLNYAYRLMHFPLGVFAVALGTVALPKIAGDIARNEPGQLVKTFNEAIGLSMFLVIPSAVYLAGYGEDLVKLIYQRGAFDSKATVETARVLYFYSFGLVGFAGVRVLAPTFYAIGDAKRPMHYSILSVAINIGLNFAFIPIWGFAGLAAATSVAGIVNMIMLIMGLKKRITAINIVAITIRTFKMFLAAIIAYFTIQLINLPSLADTTGLSGKILLVGLPLIGVSVVYLVLCRLMRLDEVNKLLNLFGLKR